MDDKDRLALLTRPGGAFPLVTREVGGRPLEVFDREPRTLREAFLATRRHGDLDALVYEGRRYTFEQQYRIVITLAHALRDRFGVGNGSRVVVSMRNFPEFAFTFWAAQVLGAVAVPLNAWLSASELADLVAEAAPAVVFADAERVERMRPLLGTSVRPGTLVGVRTDSAEVTFDDLVGDPDGRAAPEAPDATVAPDDPSTMLFTSGTTGRPKAVVGTHLNHSASLLNKLIRAVTVDPGNGAATFPAPSVRLLTFPFFHIAGINNLYSNAYSGHRTLLMRKWDAEEAVRLVATERVGEMSGPPFVMQAFLDAAATSGEDLTCLRSLGMGGSSAPARLIADIERLFGGRVSPRTGYGLTETTSGVIAIGGQDFVRRPTSVGRPLPTVDVRTVDGEGRPVPPGEEGEIVLRGPQIVAGYERAATATGFVDGWFRTGDLGRIDDDGYVYLLGRSKDVVIRGGENINCAEVEAALESHPDVAEVAVFGRPHPRLGEDLAAIVRLRENSSATVDDLRRHVAERLAAFKVPSALVLSTAEMPRTATGKIVKRGIAEATGFERLLAATEPAAAS